MRAPFGRLDSGLRGRAIGAALPRKVRAPRTARAPSDAGLASGLVNTTAQVGGALGLAVLATLSASRSDGLAEQCGSAASALTSGYHLAFWIGAVSIGLAIVVAAAVLRPAPKSRAEAEQARPRPTYSEA